jgi:hypothetical protein
MITSKTHIYQSIFLFGIILFSVVSELIIVILTIDKPILAQQQEQQNNKQSALSIVGNMRGNDGNLTATNRPPLTAKSTYYTFTKNRNEVSTPENNSHTDEFGKGTRIALVNPIFTSAAYNNSFYVFYKKYSNIPYGVNVTSDLNLLSSTVINNKKELSSSVSTMLYMLKGIKWISSQPNITLLTDADIDDNDINTYDVIILGHQEYVTQREYDKLKQFVGNGGTMIILDGNIFYAQVKYDKNVQNISLVKGHTWAYNGKSAWRSVSERWAKETSEWVGSNYLCYSCNVRFTNDPFEYRHHEEQYVTNPHDIILMNFNASLSDYPIQTRPVIATSPKR